MVSYRFLILVSLLFLIEPKEVISQDSLVWNLTYTDLLDKGTVQIDKGWKFKPGDSLEWGLKDYYDSDWVLSNSAFGYYDYNQLVTNGWNGIGWFRKKVVIDSSLADLNLAFTVYQRAATEIYIDGKLWRQFGRVSNNKDEERLYRNRSYYFSPFKLGKEHVVAVRVSNNKMENFIKNNNYGGFSLIFSEFERLLEQDRVNLLQVRTHSSIIVTFTAAFFLLHFLMFLFYPKNVTNLFYSLSVGFLSLAVFYNSQQTFTNDPENIVLFGHISLIFKNLFHLLFLRMIYNLFARKLSYSFYSILALYIVFSIYTIFTYSTSILIITILNYLVYIDIIVVLLKKRSRNDTTSSSWIISAGVIVTILIISIMNLISLGLLPIELVSDFATEYYSAFPLMISMSVYQARDLARKNDILEFRLKKIKDLSEDNLKQARRELELRVESEKQKVLFQEAEYRAKVAELQANAVTLENERKTKELDEARNLQLSMLPKKLPKTKCLEFAASMQTATEVGGDYYDFVVQDDTSIVLAIGDATGHGLSAGTMVTAVKALFRNAKIKSEKDLLSLFHIMTSSIKQMNFKKIFMSLSAAKFNTNTLSLISAGMPGMIYYDSKENKVKEIVLKGMPIGSVLNYPYPTLSMEINKGDMFLFYSDGLSELFNKSHDHFDTPRIQRIFEQNCKESAQNVIDILTKEANNWRGSYPQHDDITFLVVKKIC